MFFRDSLVGRFEPYFCAIFIKLLESATVFILTHGTFGLILLINSENVLILFEIPIRLCVTFSNPEPYCLVNSLYSINAFVDRLIPPIEFII